MSAESGRTISRFEKIVSARCFIAWSVIIAALYCGVHLLGFRDYTSILCGTVPSASKAFAGALYIILYFGFIIASPVLLGASLVFTLLRKLFLRHSVTGNR